MPVLTFRMWTIGLTLCVLSAGLNTFFNFRFPAPSIAPLVLLLISYPIGKLAAHVLPITKYRLPYWLGSHEVSFNPGPWNIKEVRGCCRIGQHLFILPTTCSTFACF